MVAIADAYDAMLSDRPYRKAIGHEAAIAELRSQAGVQFDPDLVDLFCGLFADNPPKADPTLLITPVTELKPAGRNGRPRRPRSSASSA